MAGNSSNMAEYMRERREKRRSEARASLGGKCNRCDQTEDLQFDHIDPTTKVADISSAKLLDGPKAVFDAEVAKCQLLCHPHHVEKTRENVDHNGGHNRTHVNVVCGTGPAYNAGCRCSSCTAWKSNYRAGKTNYAGS